MSVSIIVILYLYFEIGIEIKGDALIFRRWRDHRKVPLNSITNIVITRIAEDNDSPAREEMCFVLLNGTERTLTCNSGTNAKLIHRLKLLNHSLVVTQY